MTAEQLLAKAQAASPSGAMADELWQIMHERYQQGYSHQEHDISEVLQNIGELGYTPRTFTVTSLDIALREEWMRHRY